MNYKAISFILGVYVISVSYVLTVGETKFTKVNQEITKLSNSLELADAEALKWENLYKNQSVTCQELYNKNQKMGEQLQTMQKILKGYEQAAENQRQTIEVYERIYKTNK